MQPLHPDPGRGFCLRVARAAFRPNEECALCLIVRRAKASYVAGAASPSHSLASDEGPGILRRYFSGKTLLVVRGWGIRSAMANRLGSRPRAIEHRAASLQRRSRGAPGPWTRRTAGSAEHAAPAPWSCSGRIALPGRGRRASSACPAGKRRSPERVPRMPGCSRDHRHAERGLGSRPAPSRSPIPPEHLCQRPPPALLQRRVIRVDRIRSTGSRGRARRRAHRDRRVATPARSAAASSPRPAPHRRPRSSRGSGPPTRKLAEVPEISTLEIAPYSGRSARHRSRRRSAEYLALC